jgi:hypothetical protein
VIFERRIGKTDSKIPNQVGNVLLLLLAAVVIFPTSVPHAEMLVPLFTFASILLPSRFSNQIIWKFMCWLGDRSYSIYLLHMPFIYVLSYSPLLREIDLWLLDLVAILLTLVSARFTYWQIEQRYRIQSKNGPLPIKSRNAFIVFSLTPLISLLSIQYFLSATNGSLVYREIPTYAGYLDLTCDRVSSGLPCQYPVANDAGTALLIGDSMAIALSETFISQSHREGLSAVTMALGGCQFILEEFSNGESNQLTSAYRSRMGVNPISCYEHNQNVLNYIRDNKPTKVFLSQAIVPSKPSNLDLEGVDLSRIRIQSIEYLNSIVNELVVIGAPPLYHPRDPRIPIPTFWRIVSKYDSAPIQDIETDFFKDDAFLKEELESVNIEYVSLMPFFCKEGECRTRLNNAYLYHDSSHLSTSGAKLATSIFVR